MVNRSCLTELRKMAENTDRALVEWYSTVGTDKQYVSLSNIRMIVVARNMVHLMPGTVSRNADGDQQLLFSSKGLCRIRNGKRRGMIIEPHRLRPGEEAGGTGLVKPLCNGSKTNSFHMNDDRDRAVVERLHKAYTDAVVLEDIVMPATYIRGRSPANLTMRLAGTVTKVLMGLEDYDAELPMEDNFHNLINAFSRKDGATRLYPFHMVQGTGMLVVDIESIPPPLLVPLEILNKEHKLSKVLV